MGDALPRLAGADASASSSRIIPVRAMLLGARLDTRAFERGEPLATAPLALRLGERGTAVLFRYGAVILFDGGAAAIDQLLGRLAAAIVEPLRRPETEEARLRIDPGAEETVEADGTIVLREASLERLQIVADILAKSIVLAHHETRVAGIFDRTEPVAAALRQSGRVGAHGRELMRRIGDVLLTQQQIVGRAETSEKPELLWDHPELERLHARLAEEYELRDRDRALDRKLTVIANTAETLLGLVQNRSSLRVEWYIVALIVAELALSLYPLVIGR
jgi:required for meiotic nuclear division protein 1